MNYAGLTVVGGTTITSAVGNGLRDSAITSEASANPGTIVEGQHFGIRSNRTMYRGSAAATAEAYDGYGQWTSYTPVFTATAVNFPGNATITGSYRYIGGRCVQFRAMFIWGSTTNWGVNSVPVSCSLPVPAIGAGNDIFTHMRWTGFDASAGNVQYDGWIGAKDASNGYLVAATVSGSYLIGNLVQLTVPVTWATSDVWIITGTYEAAA